MEEARASARCLRSRLEQKRSVEVNNEVTLNGRKRKREKDICGFRRDTGRWTGTVPSLTSAFLRESSFSRY